MPLFSKVLFGLQGLFLLLNGVAMVVSPQSIASSLSNAPNDVITVLGLSSLTLSASQIVVSMRHQAAFRELLMCSIPLRALATSVLWEQGPEWRNVAAYEGLAGLVNAVAWWSNL